MAVEPRQVAQWHTVDATLFEKTIRPRNRPAILRGLVQSWPATRAGLESPGALIRYLESFDAGRPAPLFEAPAHTNGRFFYNDTLSRVQLRIQARACSARCWIDSTRSLGEQSAPALYAGSVSLPIYFPGFSQANRLSGPRSAAASSSPDLDRQSDLHPHRPISTTRRTFACARGRPAPVHGVSSRPDRESLYRTAGADTGRPAGEPRGCA